MNKNAIKNATSPDTAYVVLDYPCGRTARTSIRYWIEDGGKKGFRVVYQTRNPKVPAEANLWNAPKKSTYMLVAAALYIEEATGHVKSEGITEYTDPAAIRSYVETHGTTPRILQWVHDKAKFSRAFADRGVFTINGAPQEVTPGEASRRNETAKEWEDLLAALTS